MTVARAVAFGKAMCEVLGLDPARVAGLTVEASANDILRITVKMYTTELGDGQLSALVKALQADDKRVDFERIEPTRYSFTARQQQVQAEAEGQGDGHDSTEGV